MTEQKLSPILEAQDQANEAVRLRQNAYKDFISGKIPLGQMEDDEQASILAEGAALRKKEEALDMATGRERKTSFRRKLTKFLRG